MSKFIGVLTAMAMVGWGVSAVIAAFGPMIGTMLNALVGF